MVADVLPSPIQKQTYSIAMFQVISSTGRPTPRIPNHAATNRHLLTKTMSRPCRRQQPTVCSRLLALEFRIRRRILKFVLMKQYYIKPHYIVCSVEDDFKAPESQIIDASLLRVNKLLHVEASQILYSKNKFKIASPDVGNWWLKKIGRNVTQLRSLKIFLTSGIADNLFVPDERLWLRLFTMLAPHQQLKYLYISFQQWPSLARYENSKETNYGAHMRELAERARAEIVSLLRTFRGLQRVEVRGGDFFSQRRANRLIVDLTSLEG